MKNVVEFEGKSVELALDVAARDLGVAREKLRYDVVSYGSTGIFGLVGVKKAKIRVTVPEKKADAASSRESVMSLVDEAFLDIEEKPKKPAKKPRSQAPRKDARPAEKKPAAEKAEKPQKAEKGEAETPKEESGRGRKSAAREASEGRSRNGRNGRNGRTPEKKGTYAGDAGESAVPTREKKTAPKRESKVAKHIKERREAPEPTPEEGILEAMGEGMDETPVALPPLPEDAPLSDVEVTPEMVETGREVLVRILDMITEGATVTEEVKPGQILFNVEGGNSAVIIGKRGQTLEAIQYLADKIVNKLTEERVRIQIDVEGYLETRKDHLRQLAVKQADKAKRTGKPSTIGQMNAHDRRIIHLTLKDDRGVRTQSVGEGYYRRLVIFPKKTRRRKPSGGNGNRRPTQD